MTLDPAQAETCVPSDGVARMTGPTSTVAGIILPGCGFVLGYQKLSRC
jgi:hypothetical protein